MTDARVRSWWYAVGPALLAIVLGIWGLGSSGPWLDERFTIAALEDGFAQHLFEAPLLPYYAIAWAWSGLGTLTGIEWLRLLSVIAIAVAAALVAVTTRRLASPSAGLAAGLLLALSPGITRYAQEARPYASALAFMAAAALALVMAMQGGSRRWWVGYSIAVALGALMLPVTLAIVPAHAVILTTFPGWRLRVRDWSAACLFVIPVVAIEVLFGLWFRGLHAWLGPPTWDSLTTAWAWPIAGYFGDPAMLAFSALLVSAGLLTQMGRRWVMGLAVSWLILLVVSMSLMSWWTARSLVPFAGLLCVAAGLGLARLRGPWLALALVGLAALTVPAHFDVRSPTSRGVDVREVAAVLRGNAEPGDVLIGPLRNSVLAWVHRHYLGNDPALVVQADPPESGRWWMQEPITGCTPVRTWTFDGGGTLTLCE